jgi:2-dehydropantoate 2-reductase
MKTRLCIVGAGAIGGFIGARLAAAGRADVSVLARGATLHALRQHGWRLQSAQTLIEAPARAAERAGELGVQDVVVIAVKAPALTAVAESIGPLIGPRTLVVPAMNGVPWWFCQGVAEVGAEPLHSVDPGGRIARAIAFTQVLGCVVHASASSPQPGRVEHKMGQGLVVGEPSGGRSERAQALADLLSHAGFEVTHSDDVRRDIWYKLWGNMTMNPVSAITGATIDRVLADPLVRDFCSAVMTEAAAIGARIGCPIAQQPQDRHAVTAKLGAFKTSMLQDVQAGRAIELDALVTAVHEIGQRLHEPMPNIAALLGLTRLFGRVHRLYPDYPDYPEA